MKAKILTIPLFLSIFLNVIPAAADTVWVLCQPDSFVYIRSAASKTSMTCGYMECGDSAETDDIKRNGYLHLSHVSNEYGSGWISRQYIVYSKPIIIALQCTVSANGRVACWRSIGGQRRCWIKPGDTVKVLAVTREWCITNKGFIKTKCLDVDYDRLFKRVDMVHEAQLIYEDD